MIFGAVTLRALLLEPAPPVNWNSAGGAGIFSLRRSYLPDAWSQRRPCCGTVEGGAQALTN
jgi:hypothetical protein